MPTPSKPSPAGGHPRLLRCSTCGRADEASPGDLLAYTRRGWPRCCGAVMVLVTESERPDAPDATRQGGGR